MPSLMRKINILSRCEGIYRADKLKGTDLCACHHSYVLAICRNPGMSQDALAKHICINKSGVARQIAYLEEKGYVERRESEHDKRTLCVYPTQKMLDVLPDVRKIVEDWNAYIAADLTEEEILKFHEILEKAAARAKNYIYNKDETTI